MRIVLAITLLLTALPLRAGPEEEYRDQIVPILRRYCYECHSNQKSKADLNLESFTDLSQVKMAPEIWREIADRVHAYEMPPEGARELDLERRRKLVNFQRALPSEPTVDCDQIANDRNASFYRGYVMSRRLNRAEYINTIRDLFGATLDLERLLPSDGAGGEGFDTSGNALFTSTIHIEKYIAAAEHVLETILPEKTRGLSPEIKAARSKILGRRPSPSKKEARGAAKEIVGRISRLAFRRPVEDAEVERSMTMFDRAWARGDGFIPSLRLALQATLVSPHFLFLIEPEPEQKGVQPLAPLPLASKLSYFIWSSMPDEELLALAESGKLSDPNIYAAQVRRMMLDPRARALGERFAVQWLDLGRLGTEIRPDAEKFPEFDEDLQSAMLGEVVQLFNFVVQHDRPLLELIDADYTFLNERLASIYGIPGVNGPELKRVQLADSKRGGVISMGAVHALTSYPLRTSPVLRGRWVLESLIGQRVKPPPPGTPALEATAEKAKNLSLREQLQLHRASPECASCHDKMDPLGFGMENYDVVGRWREMDNGFPIDPTGKLPSGEAFTGPSGLKKILMDRKNEVVTHLVRKMAGFAYGRELNKFDDCVVQKTVEALEKSDYRASVLIEQIAMSFPFRHRFYPNLEVKNDG